MVCFTKIDPYPGEHTSSKIKKYNGFADDVSIQSPVKPSPVKTSHQRTISDLEFNVSNATFTSTRPPKVELLSKRSPQFKSKGHTSSPILGSLKRAFRGKSSPLGKSAEDQPQSSSEWPRDSMELVGLTRNKTTSTQDERGIYEDKSETHSLQAHTDGANSNTSLGVNHLFHSQRDLFATSSPTRFNYAQDAEDNEHLRSAAVSCNKPKAEVGSETYYNDEGNDEFKNTGNHNYQSITATNEYPEPSSTREGSTVDNIFKQYATTDQLWNVNLDSGDDRSEDNSSYFWNVKPLERTGDGSFHRFQAGPEVSAVETSRSDLLSKLPAAKIRKGGRTILLIDSAGQAPTAVLPQIPSVGDHQILQSTSEELGQPSSYGDTRNLLDIGRGLHLGIKNNSSLDSNLGEALHSDYKVFSQRHCDRNPYRHGLSPVSIHKSSGLAKSLPVGIAAEQSTLQPALDEVENPLNIAHVDLERDVSRALRRIGHFSNTSVETLPQNRGDGGFQSSTDSGGLLNFMGKQNDVVPKQPQQTGRCFYHEPAILQTWNRSQGYHHVRIPIRRHNSVSSSLAETRSRSSASNEFEFLAPIGKGEDGNEWETDAESPLRMIHQKARTSIKRAGSSIANTSDGGNISPRIYQHSDFSSTDRIIQHPGRIAYSHDYRCREIKQGSLPVLLPSYKPHTVNGFPAHSYPAVYPFQQNSNAFQAQYLPPMARDHTNPFSSPPPEVISMGRSRSTGRTIELNLCVASRCEKSEKGSHGNSISNQEQSKEIIDGSDEPASGIKLAQVRNISGQIRPDSYPLSRTTGSSIADASSSSLGLTNDMPNHLDSQENHKGAEPGYTTAGIGYASSLSHERTPFVKRPPGAFYQGVRSGPDPCQNGLSIQCQAGAKTPKRNALQKYPTNQMRSLSLLKAHCSPPRVQTDGSPTSETKEIVNFLYRSPLAPIKSKTWRNLYTTEQLHAIRDAAKGDGFHEIESLPQNCSHHSSGQPLNADSSWKLLPWTPHMFAWKRDNSSLENELASRKTKISNIALASCCLFPPLLVLYGVGYLDNIMIWTTKEEIRTFGSLQKRLALQLACFFIVGGLVAIPVTVILVIHASR